MVLIASWPFFSSPGVTTRGRPECSAPTSPRKAHSIFDLEQLCRRVSDPAERAVARRAARLATRRRNPRTPLTGAWYWLPSPAARGAIKWSLETFYDEWLPNSDHVVIWKHVRDLLEHRWGRTLRHIECYSLPRGRVSRMLTPATSAATYAIYHGNDAPLRATWPKLVRQDFQLPTRCRVIFDEHERCIQGQPEALSRALGCDLKVKGVDLSELDCE
jgi:hypothetical protein